MPHDKHGFEVAVGDQVVLMCIVKDVQKDVDFCNTTLETVEPMFPGTYKTTITVNAKQLEKLAEPPAKKIQFSWSDVEVQARHVIHLLETEGERAIRIVKSTITIIYCVSNRDMVGVFVELNKVSVDVQALIKAIKDEFNLN